MRVRFHGESDPLTFIDGKIYELIEIVEGQYRVVNETGEDFFCDPEGFELMKETAMKVKYIGESDPLMLLNGKIYDVMAVEGDDTTGPWYRIVDETGDDYIYPADGFEVMEA